MSVSSPCERCGANDIVDSCGRCGALVCEKHYDRSTGWCTDCATELNQGQSDEKQPDPDETYRF